MSAYKDDFLKQWIAAGGLITPAVAAKLLGVTRSVISHREDLQKYEIGDNVFVSFSEIMQREDIKPRARRSPEPLETR